jgi:hypothetical protein
MKALYKLLVLFLFSLSVSYTYGQTDTTSHRDTISTKKSHLKFGVSYLNNSVYLGRTDTVSSPSITPAISYTLKSGLYFSGSLDIITNRKNNKLDGGNLEAGYDYTLGENFEGGVSFTKLFYNANSTQLSSTLSSIVNAYADYDIGDIITPAVSLSYNISKSGNSSDFMINPNLSHDFEIEGIFGDNDFLLISPQAGINFGSQNYYAGYLEKKKRLTKKGTAAENAAYSSYYDALGKFQLLDYEITAPVEYKTGKLRFTFTPTYAFAQNSLPQSTAAEKLITKSVELSSPYKPSIFYFELGVALKF